MKNYLIKLFSLTPYIYFIVSGTFFLNKKEIYPFFMFNLYSSYDSKMSYYDLEFISENSSFLLIKEKKELLNKIQLRGIYKSIQNFNETNICEIIDQTKVLKGFYSNKIQLVKIESTFSKYIRDNVYNKKIIKVYNCNDGV